MINYAQNPLTVYAVGDCFYDCINHWATHNNNNFKVITDVLVETKSTGEEVNWSATFKADGDLYKVAGIVMSDANHTVLMTWWK